MDTDAREATESLAKPDAGLSADIEQLLAEWPGMAVETVQQLAPLIRTAGDANAALRHAYCVLFSWIPENERPRFDRLSEIIARGWDDPEAGAVMIAQAQPITARLGRTAKQMEKPTTPLPDIAEFGQAALLLGVPALALARRACELSGARPKNPAFSDIDSVGTETPQTTAL